MSHQPLGGFSGQASDIISRPRNPLIREKLNEIMSRHTGSRLTALRATPTATTS